MKIRHLPLWPFSVHVGGFEIQAKRFIQACVAAGLDAAPLAMMDEGDRADVIHYWGLHWTFGQTMTWAKRAGKKNVVTALLPSVPTSATSRSAFFVRRMMRRLIGPRLPISLVDALVVVSEEQRRVAIRFYGFRPESVFVIPHIVAGPYWKRSPEPGSEPYVLCTGNICPRKNQLALIRAAASEGFRLVISGAPMPGQQAYYETCLAEIKRCSNIRYLGNLDEQGEELVGAYLHAGAFILLSHLETQPVSALEAAVVGLPVALLDRPYGRQQLFRAALKIPTPSSGDVGLAVQKLLSNPKGFRIPSSELASTHPDRVGVAAATLYRALTDV